MRIVVAGGSGFLGRPLIRRLRAAGHDVTQLVRRPSAKPGEMFWDPAGPVRLPDNADAVINLCGANLGHRWTASYKRELRGSRLLPTATLARAVASQRIPVLVNASGVTIYGDTGDREVTEGSAHGDPSDFLIGLGIEWEEAARTASPQRVVLLRTGLPVDAHGGSLKPQLLPFRLGIGGKLGDGRQWVPWISLHDWLRATIFTLEHDVDGPVNMVGPKPVTNAEWTHTLAKLMHRPALMPVPKLGVRLLYGEYAMEGYRSMRVKPEVLLSQGFTYRHATVEMALRYALNSR
jgi:uncharacterized protein (TIGR01777 family)